MDKETLLQEYLEQKSGRRKQYHGSNIRFEYGSKKDPAATKKAGVPQEKSIELIIVQIPGGDERAIEVNDRHRVEYAEQYRAFRAAEEQPPVGYPLKKWALLDKAEVNNFAKFGIFTVEQVAEASGTVRKKLGTMDKYVKEAKEWLANAESDQTQVTALKKKLDKAEKKAKDLESQVAMLVQRIDQIEGRSMGASV